MRDKGSTFISLTLGCLLLLISPGLHAQERVVPVPVFDTPAKTAKAEAYRDAVDEMSAHLCHEPESGRTGDWDARFNELEAKLIVAEHSVYWAAAGGAADHHLKLIGEFHDVRVRIASLMDLIIPRYPVLAAPTAGIRDSENKFAIAARKARLEKPIASVHALRAVLYVFDRSARNTLKQTREYTQYLSLMNEALRILGLIQFQIYDRAMNEINELVPKNAKFRFILHDASKGNELRSMMALSDELLGEAGGSINAMELAAFDAEFSWQRTSPFTLAEFTPVQKQIMKGKCPKITVRVAYDRSRGIDAGRVSRALSKHNYTPVDFPLPSSNGRLSELHKRITFQRNGNLTEAQFIKTLLKDVEKFRTTSGYELAVSQMGADYTVWLLDRPPPKDRDVHLFYTEERREDAAMAAEILENNGWGVVRKPLDESVFMIHRPKKVVFRSRNGGDPFWANDIASVLRGYEELEPVDEGPISAKDAAPYDVWIVTKKEPPALNLNGIWRGYNYNCPGDNSIQEIRMEQADDKFIGTKISGNKCVTDGEVTLRGRITGNVMTGELNVQIGGGAQREFQSTTFKIENKDLIIVGGTIQLRRKVN